MAEVGSAFVSVMPSARGFGKKLDSEVSGDIDKSGKASGKKFGASMAGAATAVIGGAVAVGGFLKGAFDEARDAQKIGALTNAVIKSTGGVANVTAKDVDRLATSISLKTGIDDEAIAAGQNMLLTFGNVRNEIGKGNDIFTQAAIASNDMAAAFGGDAVSNSKMLGKALNDPAKGVSALTRVGVSFTQQQKDQIVAMQESGDMLGAQKIILGELTKQTGGAAEAQATMGDKFRTAFGNLQESIGTALLPLFDKLLSGLTGFATVLTNDVGPGIAALNGYLAPVMGSLKSFGGFLLANKAAVGAFVGVIATVVIGMKAWAAAQVLLNVVMSANPIGIVVVAVAALVAGIIYAYKHSQTFRNVLAAVGRVIAATLAPILQELGSIYRAYIIPAVTQVIAKFRQWMPTIKAVAGAIMSFYGRLLSFYAAVAGKVLPILGRFAAFLLRNMVRAIAAVIGILGNIIGVIGRVGSALITAGQKAAQFVSAVKDKFGEALAFFRSVPGRVTSALGDLGSVLFNAGAALMQGLANGVMSKIDSVVNAAQAALSKLKGLVPGSPIKWGPLKGWNNTGPTGPGGRLIGLLATGVNRNAGALSGAMAGATAGISLPRPSVDLGAVAGVGAGAVPMGGGVHFNGPVTTVDAASLGARLDRRLDSALAMVGAP